jgi:hypothetical protein
MRAGASASAVGDSGHVIPLERLHGARRFFVRFGLVQLVHGPPHQAVRRMSRSLGVGIASCSVYYSAARPRRVAGYVLPTLRLACPRTDCGPPAGVRALSVHVPLRSCASSVMLPSARHGPFLKSGLYMPCAVCCASWHLGTGQVCRAQEAAQAPRESHDRSQHRVLLARTRARACTGVRVFARACRPAAQCSRVTSLCVRLQRSVAV